MEEFSSEINNNSVLYEINNIFTTMTKQHRNNYTSNNITNNNLPNFHVLIIVENSTIKRLTKISDFFQLNNRYLAKFNNNVKKIKIC